MTSTVFLLPLSFVNEPYKNVSIIIIIIIITPNLLFSLKNKEFHNDII